jgi:hypothetical protein
MKLPEAAERLLGGFFVFQIVKEQYPLDAPARRPRSGGSLATPAISMFLGVFRPETAESPTPWLNL